MRFLFHVLKKMDSSHEYFDVTLESDLLFDASLESDGMDFTMDSETWQTVTNEDPAAVPIGSDENTQRDNEAPLTSTPRKGCFSVSNGKNLWCK